MATSRYPKEWPRMVQWVKQRADWRCECGTFWDGGCGHGGRCLNSEGALSKDTKREVKLRVVQLADENCWDPDTLIALCLRCWERWNQKRVEREQSLMRTIETQCDPLFSIKPEPPRYTGSREQN